MTGTFSIGRESLEGSQTGPTRAREPRTGGADPSARQEPPAVDPATAVLADPVLAESKRFCSCGHKVGRSRPGRPGRLSGFCPKDGQAFDFEPKLSPGDLVGGQYQVIGCIAHGGQGGIYLGYDKRLECSVVMKGLLNAADPVAMAAAIAEKHFLADIKHARIVGIYNFVRHGGADYIVMEYVSGPSLKQLRAQRR